MFFFLPFIIYYSVLRTDEQGSNKIFHVSAMLRLASVDFTLAFSLHIRL